MKAKVCGRHAQTRDKDAKWTMGWQLKMLCQIFGRFDPTILI